MTFSYPAKIDTYLYDDAQPTQPGGELSPPLVTGGDPLENAPHQKNIRKHLSRLVEYDQQGTLKRVTDWGAVKDEDSKPSDVADATTITLFSPRGEYHLDGPSSSIDTPAFLPCTSEWQCLPEFISIWKPQPTLPGSNPDKLLRKSRFTYNDVTKDIESVEGWLEDVAEPLNRHHPAGNNSTAPQPAVQALARGWHTFAALSYDTWGNVTRTVSGHSPGGSPPSCSISIYDGPYQHLPNFVKRFTDGCAGSALETQTIFDRGFHKVVRSIAPSGSPSEVHYDPFGRPIEVYAPNPDAAAGTQKPVLAATIWYSDRKPLSYIDVRRVVGPGANTRSVSILNGLGESVVAFDQGDNKDWVLKDWRETNLSGQVEKVRRPWAYTGNPITAALNANTFPIPWDNSFFEMRYDDFGRKVSMTERDGSGFSHDRMRTSYFPLALETRDAEQLKPGGPHDKAFQRIEFDGRGRRTRTVEHIGNPATDNIVTTVIYNPMGEPGTITRTHAGSPYQRTMEFDTLGRLMVNKEPNTGNNWRYAWDDAGRLVGTSDARGCGVNFHYDGLSRLIGEDYSPCLASQPAYTSPNLTTGEGLETFYRYDAYEVDQVSPEPIFSDDPKFALGHLVAVRDRGSYTRFNYDARDRVRRISRQIAKPEGLNRSSPYAPHWFTSRLDYDFGDRVTRRTTGVDVQELLMNGGSEERYAYTPRGQLSNIDSSYGAIVQSMTYDPEGAPTQIVYGDVRGATARFVYDSQHRLTLYQLIAPSNIGLPLPIGYFDYRFSAYDDVGNPLVIEDFLIAWQPLPPEASPVEKRVMEYDDFYRLTRINNTYKERDGIAPWRSPFEAEVARGDRHPVPMRALPTRVTQQTFDYDGLGNLTASSDDLSAHYDRSLGPNLGYGTPDDGPNQLRSNGPNQLRSGAGLQIRYDQAGNLSELKLERAGTCPSGAANQCAQWFAYDWDEVGQLARARRWDFDGNALPPQASPDVRPVERPRWDVTYAYSQGARVRKSVADTANVTQHTLEVFDTLRVEQAPFDSTNGSYKIGRDNVHAYPGGMAHVFWDAEGLLPHQAPDSLITMHLVIGDHLGSSSVLINHATSELVERTTYQPYGAVESDYRPAKWKAFREPYKFTGKEEDIEVGATYFGARYYQPYLGRFMSADPLTTHGLGSGLNPYAYVGGRLMTHVDPWGLDDCSPPSCTPMPEGDPEDVIRGPAKPEPTPTPNPIPTPQPTEVTIDETGVSSDTTARRDPVSFQRDDDSTSRRTEKASVASAVFTALGQSALDLIDMGHVNRNFVKDVLTVGDRSASPLSRGASGVGAVLAVAPLLGEARAVLGTVEAASPFRTMLVEDGVKIIGVMTKTGSELQVAFEEVREGATLTLKGVHIQGASPGAVGPKELLALARQYGREQGAEKIVIEGARRTTSSMAGRVPRPWVLNVGE